MMRTLPVIAPLLLAGCGHDAADPATDNSPKEAVHWPPQGAYTLYEAAMVDDHFQGDELMAQVTFALADSSFLAVAAPAPADQNLRLYHYAVTADSVEIRAISSSGHDSYTYYPTLLAHSIPGSYVVLGNFGERDSWGQKVLLLDSSGFHDLGFLEIATRSLRESADTSFYRLTNCGPTLQLSTHGDTLRFRSTADSLVLFQDGRGGVDVVRPAAALAFELLPNGERWLVDGKERFRLQGL